MVKNKGRHTQTKEEQEKDDEVTVLSAKLKSSQTV